MTSAIGLTIRGAGADSPLGKRIRSALEHDASLSRAAEIRQALWNEWRDVLSTGTREAISDCVVRMLTLQGDLDTALTNAIVRAMGEELYAAQDMATRAPLRVELVMPQGLSLALTPSAGVAIEYDEDGRVVGTRPRAGA